MKRLLVCLIALAITMCSFSVSAEEGVAWNGENSIIVTVISDTDKTFEPKDFPELNCADVTVVSKNIGEDGFTYRLILQLELGEGSLVDAMKAVSENSAVVGVRRNVFDTLDPILLLNRTTVTVPLGQSADVFIDIFDTYGNNGFYYGVIFTVDPETVDISTADENTFGFEFKPINAECDNRDLYDALTSGFDPASLFGEAYAVSPINKYYTMVSEFGVGGDDGYKIIEAVNDVLALDGVIAAEPLGMEFPCARMPSEQWTIGDSTVAEMTLSGGEAVGVPENLIGQTATVTGVAKGKTIVTLSANDNSQGASATCEIIVINSGDANSDGALDNLDASVVLKHDAGLNELSDEILAVSDMNGDGLVDNLDAAIILKFDAGLL